MGVIQTWNGWGHQDLHNTILIAMNSDLDPVYFLEGRTLRKEVCFCCWFVLMPMICFVTTGRLLYLTWDSSCSSYSSSTS